MWLSLDWKTTHTATGKLTSNTSVLGNADCSLIFRACHTLSNIHSERLAVGLKRGHLSSTCLKLSPPVQRACMSCCFTTRIQTAPVLVRCDWSSVYSHASTPEQLKRTAWPWNPEGRGYPKNRWVKNNVAWNVQLRRECCSNKPIRAQPRALNVTEAGKDGGGACLGGNNRHRKHGKPWKHKENTHFKT